MTYRPFPQCSLISNLDYNVTDFDVRELFSSVGELQAARTHVHYDRSGRSLGTAEVVYMRKQDALEAVRRCELREGASWHSRLPWPPRLQLRERSCLLFAA